MSPFVIVDGVTVQVDLVGSSEPRPVQVVLDGLSAGQSVIVTGTAGGHTWSVPGGAFTATGEQVVLVDNRSPVNTPVVYAVVVDGQAINSPPITVPYHANHLIQSLDGRTIVDFVWMRIDLPQEPTIRSVAFDVPGRARPPVRFTPGGDGGGSLRIRTSRAGTDALRSLLRAGRPVVVRTDGQMRDWPGTELVLLTSAPSVLWGAIDEPDHRVWDMAFLFVDDPEPGTPVSAFTWSDFDAAWDGQTWDDFDAFFDGLTWDAFDRMDWTELG